MAASIVVDALPFVLAPVLVAGGGAKLVVRGAATGQGVAALFRPRYERAVTLAVGGLEVTAGAALLLVPAPPVRLGVVALFAAALGVVLYLRRVRPQSSCGCLGALSTSPIGRLTVLRASLLLTLAVAAVAASGRGLGALAGPVGLAALAVLAVLVVVSPELWDRLGRRHVDEVPTPRDAELPCAVRGVPHELTENALRASAEWQRHLPVLRSAQPLDAWREACWRFYVYPAEVDGRPAEVVFAVSVDGDPPPVLATVVAAGGQEILRAAAPDLTRVG